MNEENDIEIQENNIQNNLDNDYNFKNNNLQKEPIAKILLLLIGIILAIVIAFGMFYYFKVYTRADEFYKRIIGDIIDNTGKQLLDLDDYKTLESQIALDANIDITDTSMFGTQEKNIIDLINETNIVLGTKIDKEKQKVIIDLKSDYDKEKLLNLKIYNDIKDKKLYIYLENLLDKYLELDEDDIGLNEIMEDTNLTFGQEIIAKQFIKELRKEILKSIKMEYCSNTKEEIVIDNNKIKATKNTLKIGYGDFIKELGEILKRAKENQKMLDCLNEQGKKDFIDFIDNMLENIENTYTSYSDDIVIEYNLYTKGILMTDVIKIEAKVYSENKPGETMSIEANKKTDTQWEYNIPIDNSTKLYGIINFEEENKGSIAFNFKVEEFGTITLNIGYSAKYDIVVDEIDVNNAIKLEELTQEDQITLMTNLENSKLYEIVSMFSANSENDSLFSNETTVQVLSYDNKNLMTVNVPAGYTVENISDTYKVLEKGNNTEIIISSYYGTSKEYYEKLQWDKEYYSKQEGYKNVKLSDTASTVVNNLIFYYTIFEYEMESGEYNYKTSTEYIWTPISDNYVALFELKGLEGITSEELNTVLSSLEIQSR